MTIFVFFQIEYFWSCNYNFLEFLKFEILGFFQIQNSWNSPNWTFLVFFKLGIWNSNFPKWQFLEHSKLEFFGIVRIEKLTNFSNSFHSENQNLAPKIGNFGIVCPFNIPHYNTIQINFLNFYFLFKWLVSLAGLHSNVH